MKLRNKQTGEVGNLVLNINPNRESYSVLSTKNGDTLFGNAVIGDYDSLSELNEEWEDYVEPKEYWFIDSCGGINKQEADILGANRREIGNYFETKEEAEKAVEKLKAWKRLKDKGFKFEWWLSEQSGDHIEFYMDSFEWDSEATKDLDLLFGSGDLEAKNE